MHTSMTVQIQLALAIHQEARDTLIALSRANKPPDHILTYYYPPRKTWRIESERRGKPQVYLLDCDTVEIYYPSAKFTSGRPININGLSLADRQRLIKDLQEARDKALGAQEQRPTP